MHFSLEKGDKKKQESGENANWNRTRATQVGDLAIEEYSSECHAVENL
jgi:hypothetical protein